MYFWSWNKICIELFDRTNFTTVAFFIFENQFNSFQDIVINENWVYLGDTENDSFSQNLVWSTMFERKNEENLISFKIVIYFCHEMIQFLK